MANRVSTSFSRNDWLRIRENLKDKGVIYTECIDTINLIRERVDDRYFKPLEILIEDGKSYQSAGFAIATIECSMIEFIAALTEGRLFKKNLSVGDNTHRFYSDSALVYSKFLRTSPIFSEYFSSPTNTPRFRPDDFYRMSVVRSFTKHKQKTTGR